MQKLIEELKAAAHTEVFHGSGAQRSIELGKAISIVKANTTQPPMNWSREEMETIIGTLQPIAYGNWRIQKALAGMEKIMGASGLVDSHQGAVMPNKTNKACPESPTTTERDECQSIKIGKYLITQYPQYIWISLYGEGEGGGFDEAKVEDVIDKFYEENF